MKMYAKVLADSIYAPHNVYGRVITIEATNPKFIDAECEKHGNLRSNSSSSRAIPTDRLLKQVREDPYLPEDVRLNQRGMQGDNKIKDVLKSMFHSHLFDLADHVSNEVVNYSKILEIHKQHVNRYIEPFTVQCKVITANYEDWMSMLKLRLAEDADPNIQEWARNIQSAILESESTLLKYDEWHLPYVTSSQRQQFTDEECRCISVSRCASVSYYKQGVDKTIEEDIKKTEMLANSGHWSCFEHQLTPMLNFDCNDSEWPDGVSAYSREGYGMSGAFKRWVCFRNLLSSKK